MIFLKVPQLSSMFFSIKSKLLHKACRVFMFCLPVAHSTPPLTRSLLVSIRNHNEVLHPKTPSPAFALAIPTYSLRFNLCVASSDEVSHCLLLPKHSLCHSYSVFPPSQLDCGLLEKIILFYLYILRSKCNVWLLISA